jgi:hypothetical protein
VDRNDTVAARQHAHAIARREPRLTAPMKNRKRCEPFLSEVISRPLNPCKNTSPASRRNSPMSELPTGVRGAVVVVNRTADPGLVLRSMQGNSPPGTGGVARSAGVVDKSKRFLPGLSSANEINTIWYGREDLSIRYHPGPSGHPSCSRRGVYSPDLRPSTLSN